MRGLFLLFGVPVFIISLIILFRHYNNSSKKQYEKRLSEVNLLLKNGVDAEAIFDSTYTFVKRRGEDVGTTIGYQFVVNSTTYTDEKYFHTNKEVPTDRSFIITYLKDNPKIHSDNPQVELETLQAKMLEGSTPIYGWWMFGITVAGFIYVRWSLKKDRKRQQEIDEMIAKNNSIV